jgi:prevent-host-death family protein
MWASVSESELGASVVMAQAKSQFAALVARAEAGEKIVVTRSGRAVACLGPLPGRQPIKYGELRGVFLTRRWSCCRQGIVIRSTEC